MNVITFNRSKKLFEESDQHFTDVERILEVVCQNYIVTCLNVLGP